MRAAVNLSDETCRFLMIVTRPASRTSSAPDGTTLPRCRLVRLRLLRFGADPGRPLRRR